VTAKISVIFDIFLYFSRLFDEKNDKCLSVTRLNSASHKTAEQIEILFGGNTFGGPGNIVLDRGSDPPTEGGIKKNFAHCRPPTLHVLRMAEGRHLKFCMRIKGWGS